MELSRSGNDVSNIEKITNQIQKLEKAVSRATLPTDFTAKLEQLVLDYQCQGRGAMSTQI